MILESIKDLIKIDYIREPTNDGGAYASQNCDSIKIDSDDIPKNICIFADDYQDENGNNNTYYSIKLKEFIISTHTKEIARLIFKELCSDMNDITDNRVKTDLPELCV